MATISIDIPDDQVDRINDAFAARSGWNAKSDLTQTQNTERQLAQFVVEVVQTEELRRVDKQAAIARESVMAARPPIVT